MGEVWDVINDDSDEEFEDWEPRIDDDSRWYILSNDGEVAGAFWMRRVNHITWEAHANVRPKYWGDKKGTEFCRKAIEEMIADTGALKVVAQIPTSSPQTMKMAEAIGFEREGTAVRSLQKKGKLYDVVHYGITRT